ncbi:MAG: family 43 glycosylhydrolase [Opitutaceae bacterium]|jgi:GH43 family beta-xylosidase|nr:family 43 glycosylhydrolase [Opitutaceae bacterium]
MKTRLPALLLSFVSLAAAGAGTGGVPLADPFILLHDGVYYAYGTGGSQGFPVYVSDDLGTWEKAPAPALAKTDSFGEKQFWAPEVYYRRENNTFYMFYSAEEHICVATAESPLGPFAQKNKRPMLDEKAIDSTLFIDDDGKAWLFFVRTRGANVIWGAELSDDWETINMASAKKCVQASLPWERVQGNVAEGPSVFKRAGVYHMLYSANGYTSRDYGIGLATAKTPLGPWMKFEKNPILQNPEPALAGVGHGAPFWDKNGNGFYVFHAHFSPQKIHPRRMYVAPMKIGGGGIEIDKTKIIIPRLLKDNAAGAGISLEWDGRMEFVTHGGYGRVKKLSTGEIALVYSGGPAKGTAVYIRKKKTGAAWGKPVRVAMPEKPVSSGENPDYRYVNSEMIELADGRLFYTWNARPVVRDGHLPYKIMGAFSSDGGATWGAGRDLYVAGKTWKTGCWEPCPLQIPGGGLQVWFSDESTTPDGDQNITVLRSPDNGVTWLKPVVACYRKGHRDGMPVPVLLQNNKGLVFSIEDNGMWENAKKNALQPVIVRPFFNVLNGEWSGVVDGASPRRWHALAKPLPPETYAGAPCLIQLNTGETLLSVQSNEGRVRVPERKGLCANLRVYIGDAGAKNFANPATPFPDLPQSVHALWNSLCQIDNDTVIAVSTVSGLPRENGIYIATAKISRAAGADSKNKSEKQTPPKISPLENAGGTFGPSFSSAGAGAWPEMEWFAPGILHGNSDHLRPNSFGASDYYTRGNYTIWMREDRMPADAPQSKLHWPLGQSTVGMQLIATGHTGADACMAWDVESYSNLYKATNDPHCLETAAILLHNTKAMDGYPGGNRGPGWRQEHCRMNRPRGRHRAWLPWVTASQLRGINDLADSHPELYRQLCTATGNQL